MLQDSEVKFGHKYLCTYTSWDVSDGDNAIT